MIAPGLALRALLIAVWTVEIDPETSLIVTTLSPPVGFSMKVLFGTVYSRRLAPCPAKELVAANIAVITGTIHPQQESGFSEKEQPAGKRAGGCASM